MVMTVEPGFGGQSFMADVAKAKLPAAREILSHKLHGGEVHVDGGVNRETAELVGGLGVDILVVGSALWIKGRDMGREIRLIRALADEGYQYRLNDGVPPIPRDRMTTFASLRRPQARQLREEVEAAGIPVLLFRSPDDPADMDDEVRRWDVLIPASAEAAAKDRFAGRRATPSSALPPDMRALLQRVSRASVDVGGATVATIGAGLLVLVGVGHGDDDATADALARRITELRIFADEEGRTNRSILDIGGAALVVSQFTLYADTSRGRRPGFTDAADPALAERLYLRLAQGLRDAGVADVQTGAFGAEMAVELVNDGPFTIWLDTAGAASVNRGPVEPA